MLRKKEKARSDQVIGSTVKRATSVGRARARYLGTSSLSTICAEVSTTSTAMVAADTEAALPNHPHPSKTGASRTAMVACAKAPTRRLVRVIPIWLAEMYRSSFTGSSRMGRRRTERVSPSSARCRMRPLRTETAANSAAT
jgi:hypothetical protein